MDVLPVHGRSSGIAERQGDGGVKIYTGPQRGLQIASLA
jgi:hypothetical protein